MVDIKTKHAHKLIILGAGASSDYGLPIWDELVIKIRDIIGKDNISSTLRNSALRMLCSVGEKYDTLD